MSNVSMLLNCIRGETSDEGILTHLKTVYEWGKESGYAEGRTIGFREGAEESERAIKLMENTNEINV